MYKERQKDTEKKRLSEKEMRAYISGIDRNAAPSPVKGMLTYIERCLDRSNDLIILELASDRVTALKKYLEKKKSTSSGLPTTIEIL